MSVPQQIGRYRISGELGRGGMGIVYRGEDRLIGREVAIKTLTDTTPELRERFFIEARSGILSHPNIVTVYELGEHEGSPFIAMECVTGESLEGVLRTRKRLPLLEALSIMEQMCAGLGYAHGQGVVHRDVKPANILIRPDGRITIVDFGIARLADQTQHLTQADALLGTFHYIAPERLKGEVSDGRADVWSAGVILYEMLTGELPFRGKDVSSLYRVIHEPYVALSEYVRDLPDGLSEVLDKALAKKVEDRYRTAEEVSFDLQVIAEGLKHDRVNTLIATARRLAVEQQFASARTVLLQAQRIDPGNPDAKLLMQEVQDRLSHLQRDEQLRQILEQAQSALGDRRWDDAIAFFQQAAKLDGEDALGVKERLANAMEQKRQQQRLVSLWEQAGEARSRGDLTQAQALLTEALTIDERNTDLRNAHSVVLRELERRQRGLHVEEHLRNAREDFGAQRYTDALVHLRTAAELDPTRTDVQQLLFTVATRQKEERRQELLEKIAAEIHESLEGEDFALAQDRIQRALESLPGEALLLRLKSEAQARKQASDTQRVVRDITLAAQGIFVDDPAAALALVQRGLESAPTSEALQHLREQLEAHLREAEVTAARSQALTAAHAALARKDFRDARRVLDTEIAAHGATEDLEGLLTAARAGQEQEDREHAEQLRTKRTRAVIDTAVAGFEKALAAGDLKRCLRPVEAMAQQHGPEPGVAEAVQNCGARRRQAAQAIVTAAVEQARGLARRGACKEANGLLRRADFAVPFVSAAVGAEFARLRAECGAATREAREGWWPRSRPALQGVVAVAMLLTLVAVIAGLRLRRPGPARVAEEHSPSQPQAHREATPAPAALPMTDMEINATPWATVTQVQREDGSARALPGGNATTPLRLDGVPVGQYTITLTGHDGEQHTLRCRVSLTDHLCSAELASVDVHRLLNGEQP